MDEIEVAPSLISSTAPAGGTAAEFQLAVLTLHLVILPLLSQNNNMFPLRAFKRRHFKVLEALETMCGGWGVVGASPGYLPK